MSDGTLPADDATSLSLLFHLNSEPWLNADAYAGAGQSNAPLAVGDPPPVALPPAEESPLTGLLRARRSCRSFERRAMPCATLAQLLSAAAGVSERTILEDGSSFRRRAAPSAGGMFPLDTYVFARDVDNVAEGVHRYDHLAHGLVEVARADVGELLQPALYAYPFAASANVFLAFAATFARAQRKYGPRGYRYILLEAGHCAQNACLRAAELQLGTLCIGGFADGAVNRLLALEPTEAGVVYMVAAGYPAAG
jgi:SagB-type dehydrogenase family enzyme